MSLPTYQIHVRDHNDSVVAIFAGVGRNLSAPGGLQSLSYRKRLRTPGGSTVRIYGNDQRIFDYLLLDDGLDYRLEFYRSDPVGGLDSYLDYVAFHRAENWTQDVNGRFTYISYGQGLNVLLASEVIRADEGSAGASKSGDVATVARAYVKENIGASAGNDDLGNSRVRPNLTVVGSDLTGVTWSGDRANQLLADVVDELAEKGDGEYMIDGFDDGSMTFGFRPNPWGFDRRVGNGDGNAPVVFSTSWQNVEQFNGSYSHLNEINTVYVLGQGAGDLQKVRTRANSSALALSPWARRAVTRTEGNEYDNGALDDAGDAVIEEGKSLRQNNFRVLQTSSTRYGRDWDVGDFVTVEHLGRSYDMKVVGVTIGLGGDGNESITAEFEDV